MFAIDPIMTSKITPPPSNAEQTHLRSLVEVLLPHSAGLRRWSVMRAIRSRYSQSEFEISLKLEDEVERVFRRHGGDASEEAGRDKKGTDSRLFYRPKERAGEVWAVDADKARAWLDGSLGVSAFTAH